ncbi:MAG: abortive infection family protein [Vicinamibacterales bacterium]
MSTSQSLFEEVETFQNLLISYATGGKVTDQEYKAAREALLARPGMSERLPRFVRTHRDLSQLWGHFKKESSSYQGRREYIWKEFGSLLSELEANQAAPGDARVNDALSVVSQAGVHAAWQTALDRRVTDPDGAITSARTLLEAVCKHVLDDLGVTYDRAADLPKLYRQVSESMAIAPSQQTEPIFKQVMGGATAVVEGIGAMRNRLGDADGKGAGDADPDPAHAELAVNLAGAAATFIIQTWEKHRAV